MSDNKKFILIGETGQYSYYTMFVLGLFDSHKKVVDYLIKAYPDIEEIKNGRKIKHTLLFDDTSQDYEDVLFSKVYLDADNLADSIERFAVYFDNPVG
jgi:hypothetical protein